jgi:DNA-binding transcriptional regulator/RsmH inhibitor MraZ
VEDRKIQIRMGSHLLSLDGKHRVTIPAMFQRLLKQQDIRRLFVTYGITISNDYRYLDIYPDLAWADHVQKLMKEIPDHELPYWMRYYIEPASPIAPDQQGRLVVHPHFRNYLGLKAREDGDEAAAADTENQLYIVAASDHFRLYRWKDYMQAMEHERAAVPMAETDHQLRAEYDRTQIVDSIRELNRTLREDEE